MVCAALAKGRARRRIQAQPVRAAKITKFTLDGVAMGWTAARFASGAEGRAGGEV